MGEGSMRGWGEGGDRRGGEGLGWDRGGVCTRGVCAEPGQARRALMAWVGVAHTGVSSVLRIAKVVGRAFAKLLLALAFAPCMRRGWKGRGAGERERMGEEGRGAGERVRMGREGR